MISPEQKEALRKIILVQEAMMRPQPGIDFDDPFANGYEAGHLDGLVNGLWVAGVVGNDHVEYLQNLVERHIGIYHGRVAGGVVL